MASKKALKDMAAAATDGMFTGSEPAKTAKQKKEPAKNSGKGETMVFSCRMEAGTVADWKAYIDAVNGKTGEMTENAVMEYMSRHNLTDEQRTVYKIKRRK